MKTLNMKNVLCLAILAITSACKQTTPPPAAEKPDVSMRGDKIAAAEAEATGINGPFELTLRIFKTKIVSEKESLWYQVRLRNISREEIPVYDPAFLSPTPIEIHGSVGVSLQVTDPYGKRLKKRLHLHGYGGGVLVPGSPSWPIQDDDKRDAATKKKALDTMWADRAILRQRTEYEEKLRREGRSEQEIVRESLKFDEEHPQSDALEDPKPRPFVMLKPGASITSVPWTDRHVSDPDRQSEFSEFVGYWYSQPGKYLIHARFNNRSSDIVEDYNKEHGIPPRIDAVLVETRTIEFEVLP